MHVIHFKIFKAARLGGVKDMSEKEEDVCVISRNFRNVAVIYLNKIIFKIFFIIMNKKEWVIFC